MKKKNYLELLLLTFTCYFIECSHQKPENRPNGWYSITEGIPDSLSEEPIVTVADFEKLYLDSIVIIGRLQPQSVDRWADATEKSIGKQIGFLYHGKVICAPQINARIEGGRFSLSLHPDLYGRYDIGKIYEDLYKEMNAIRHPAP